MELWLKDISVELQGRMQSLKRFSSATVIMSLLQKLNHMDTMLINGVLEKLLGIVIVVDPTKGKQCLEGLIMDIESRFEANDTFTISHCSSCIINFIKAVINVSGRCDLLVYQQVVIILMTCET